MNIEASSVARQSWTTDAILALIDLPFADLLHQAHTVHRQNFAANTVQMSALLSVKTGGCPEDCGYCSQSAHNSADVVAEKLVPLADVVAAATRAKAVGATRFCMGAAWRAPKDRDLAPVIDMIKAVKALGMETCATLGMVTPEQAAVLKEAGLDYYNHNLDTSQEHYPKVVTTRTFDDRLETLGRLRDANIKLCTGGIIGMGETRRDRASMLRTLANLPYPPESVPINLLVPIPGTPLAQSPRPDVFELVRTIAAARITMPRSHVRLSAGRSTLSDEGQALCFHAGANSMFCGDRLLTTDNTEDGRDAKLFKTLGITPEPHVEGTMTTTD